MKPAQTILQFDAFLAHRGIRFEAIVTGGAALALLGIVQRETRDCDVIEPGLPESVLAASRAFAVAVREQGGVLQEDWLNNGPASLAAMLPDGWRARLQPIFQGSALRLWSLGRPELLLAKLWALCDRGLDLPDCMALAPSPEELQKAMPWIATQDLNPDWPAHVKATLQDLARRLGHGV
ncbi:MAG TPA: DUF6036 family nucleotidyltransferase [Holophaga sp.]|nr:DUF6036 family nucleotidyltransferase [Holophaga sp.]